MSKSSKVTLDQILIAVRSRSEWAMNASSVANPERVARIDDLVNMFDATGTKLRAYVNAAGVATLETNAEYKIRKGIRSDAKQARKTATPPASPAFDPASATAAQTAQNALLTLQSLGIDVSALLPAAVASVPVASPAPAAKVKKSKVAKVASTAVTDSATKNATIQAIDRKCETLGRDRRYAEKIAGFALTDMSVRSLREVNRVLGERIMQKAREN